MPRCLETILTCQLSTYTFFCIGRSQTTHKDTQDISQLKMKTFALAALVARSTAAPASPLADCIIHLDSSQATKAGWTHEEFFEYRSLNDTRGWAGLDKIPHVTIMKPGKLLDFSKSGLSERADVRDFRAFEESECGGELLFESINVGCGTCVSTPG